MIKNSRAVLVAMMLNSLAATSSEAEFLSSGNFFDDFDADQDGMVSQTEYTGPEVHFSQLDVDDNGYIYANEGPAGPREGDRG